MFCMYYYSFQNNKDGKQYQMKREQWEDNIKES